MVRVQEGAAAPGRVPGVRAERGDCLQVAERWHGGGDRVTPALAGETPVMWAERVREQNGWRLPTLPSGIGSRRPRVVRVKPEPCAYCGEPAEVDETCESHADLPELDPLKNNEYRALTKRELRDWWRERFTQAEIDALNADLDWLDKDERRTA
jgi:hypothetical protein